MKLHNRACAVGCDRWTNGQTRNRNVNIDHSAPVGKTNFGTHLHIWLGRGDILTVVHMYQVLFLLQFEVFQKYAFAKMFTHAKTNCNL